MQRMSALLILMIWNAVITSVYVLISSGKPDFLHEKFSSMMSGAIVMDPNLQWLALGLGVGIQVQFILIFLLAFKKTFWQKHPAARWVLGTGGVLYIGLFIAMNASYWNYEEANAQGTTFGFPTPTAIMLFGLGFIPLYFILTYLINFDKWIYTLEDEQSFQALLTKRNRGEL